MTPPIRCIYYLVIVFWAVVLHACETAHIVQLDVALTQGSDVSDSISVELGDTDIQDALHIIENVAQKHDMENGRCDYQGQKAELCRFYVKHYEIPGPIASASGDVTIHAVVKKKENIMHVILMDHFRITQSKLSQDIQQSLLSALTEHYGEDAVQLIQ